MNPWPGPASVFLMDNCAIHKSQVLQDAVAEKSEFSHSLDSKLILQDVVFYGYPHTVLSTIQLKKALIPVS